MRWIDDHCHLHRDLAQADAQVAAAAEAGVERLITVGCDVASRPTTSRSPAGTRGGCGPRPACTPTTPRTASTASRRSWASPRSWRWGSAGSTSTTTTRPATSRRRCSPPRSRWPTPHDLALVIHTREAWPETFDILAAEGVPARTSSTASRGGPDEARRCLDLGAVLSFSGIVSFPSATDLQDAARALPARPAPRRDRQPVPGAGAPPGEEEPARLGHRRRRRAVAEVKGRRAGRCREGDMGHGQCHLPPAPD